MGGPSILEVLITYYPLFLRGLWSTLKLAFISVLLGTLLGALISMLTLSKNKIINAIGNIYITIFRGTPILVQLYIFYYFMPMVIPILNSLPKVVTIVMALVINSSSYVSEIIRGGILAVDKGQTEAARSLGMTSKNCMMKIVLPQAIKSIIPSLGNEYIMMIKETSLASTLAYNELMFVKTILSNKFLIWQPLFIISGIYLMVTLVLTYGVSLLEKRLSVSD
ncbi:MAG: amino acid ABC transporter permease [Erysipelotrichaceae bacterium]|jgi:His/Glu/Gln/Arg/opine family amino acid ABC transporter permease subunit|nr:amino acid ABC transporter permease [Bacillota bacterium]NLP21999.1 amino acid ABC transporter permease [Erysipelotrichaceae bacterium]HCY06039.1 arginine ABC transporter permease [Erysipelotrichaceae bacterium]